MTHLKLSLLSPSIPILPSAQNQLVVSSKPPVLLAPYFTFPTLLLVPQVTLPSSVLHSFTLPSFPSLVPTNPLVP